eukprot:TRINITY_DN14066_c0_g1_i3.p1 TRINITY_DN14066_c0_g1~~TRINITY_DN14066_c0_g1_i3.p1  ORF type:complete len:291 (+),score=68.35 TRINITY_DN14066_c0_g1_i3:89-961(+)
MLRANVWLFSGDSLGSFDLDPENCIKTLRAQVESELKVSNFHEVKLFRGGQETQELNDADEVSEDMEVQAVLVVSLTKSAEMLSIAAKERQPLPPPTVHAFIDTFATVENLQVGQESQRLLKAMFTASHATYMRGPDLERMGNVFGRLCNDYTFFLDILVKRLLVNALFAVPAVARMASRQGRSTMNAHADIIFGNIARCLLCCGLNLVDAISFCEGNFFVVASDSTLADAIQLLATFGTDKDLAMLAAKFARLHRILEACDNCAAPRLQLFLEQLRALMEAETSRTSCA